MNCFQHPERSTEICCNSCSRPLCAECKYELAGQTFCRNCIETVLENGGTKINRPAIGLEKKSRFWTFILSLVPGVGYLYLGLMKRGLQAMVTLFGTIFVGNMIGLEALIALILPVLMFYTIFDSQQLVRKINAGFEVEDNELFAVDWLKFEHRWVGYALIALGALALLNNVLPMIFSTYMFRAIVGPIVVIGAGVYILYRNTKS